MEHKLEVTVAKVNEWIANHNAWIADRGREYGCDESDLVILPIAGLDGTVNITPLHKKPASQSAIDEFTKRAAKAATIANKATIIASYQRSIIERTDDQATIYAAKERATASDAVCQTAVYVAKLHIAFADKAPHMKDCSEAEAVAMVASWRLITAVTVIRAAVAVHEHQNAVYLLARGTKKAAAAAAEKAATAAAVSRTAASIFDILSDHLERHEAVAKATRRPSYVGKPPISEDWIADTGSWVVEIGTSIFNRLRQPASVKPKID